MNIEHAICKPAPNSKGINGGHIAIVGYSHFYDPSKESDRTELTNDVLDKVVSGSEKLPFFTSIRNYFDYADEGFWRNVFFFNFIPNCIGKGEDRFRAGTFEQICAAKKRVSRILNDEPRIERIFVFSRKAWRDFPLTAEEISNQQCNPLFPNMREPSWGTYPIGRRRVLACGFQHPLGANGEFMRKAIKEFWTIR